MGKHSAPQPVSPGYIPRHATNYDPKIDISKSLPAAKKVNGKLTPVTATYTPKHSSRNYTPIQQMRAHLAASRGTVYNPANPAKANPQTFAGVKMGQTQQKGSSKKKTQPQNLNKHQFGTFGTIYHAYEKITKPHEGRNKQILESMERNGKH
jgi:flagellar hook-length control protein FliK